MIILGKKNYSSSLGFHEEIRRTKDYVYVFESLITEAAVHGYKIDPTDFMIDFESAAKKAIEIIFSKCIVKGCLFHYIVKAYIVSF